MFKVVSNNYPEPCEVNTLYEAQVIKGRDYNLFLADILQGNSNANPVRGNSDMSAFVEWDGKRIFWDIEEVDAA